jgi:hypothetical protein
MRPSRRRYCAGAILVTLKPLNLLKKSESSTGTQIIAMINLGPKQSSVSSKVHSESDIRMGEVMIRLFII